MPQFINLARGAVSKTLSAPKDSSEASDNSSPYRRKPKPIKRRTPEMRCNIEVYAGRGSLIVVISRFTGLLLFTLLPQRSLAYTAESAITSRFSGTYDKQVEKPLMKNRRFPLITKPEVRRTRPYGSGIRVYTL